MARRAGSADLPLHGGQVPKWLEDRMTRLGAVMSEAIVHHYGRDELLRRLAHPFWFQSFGAVMGMDWHSSGVTTSVIGALRRVPVLSPQENTQAMAICATVTPLASAMVSRQRGQGFGQGSRPRRNRSAEIALRAPLPRPMALIWCIYRDADMVHI